MKYSINHLLKRSVTLMCAVSIHFTAFAEPQLVTLKKGEQQIDLFGTIHIAKPEFYPLPKTVTHALKNSDALAVEFDSTDPQMLNEMNSVMMDLASDSSNRLSLDAQRMEQLKAVIGPMAESFQSLPIWLTGATVVILRAQQIGFTATGIDETLITEAKQLTKPVISLETPTEQFQAFDGIPDTESLAMFDSAVSDDGIEELEKTTELWLDGSESVALALIKEAQSETPQFYEKVVTDRNITMAERIIQHNSAHKSLFVGIGALHLYGEKNVIQLLEENGYQRVD